jgi:hypothetical protein
MAGMEPAEGLHWFRKRRRILPSMATDSGTDSGIVSNTFRKREPLVTGILQSVKFPADPIRSAAK